MVVAAGVRFLCRISGTGQDVLASLVLFSFSLGSTSSFNDITFSECFPPVCAPANCRQTTLHYHSKLDDYSYSIISQKQTDSY